MRELRDIAARIAFLRQGAAPFALATVVRVEGSAYRREGARMLVEADGRVTGAISGGCLEGEVIEQARDVLREGRPRLVSFRLGADDPYIDAALGFGTGCDGVVHLLIEPSQSDCLNPLSFVADLESRRSITLATVFASDNSALVGCRAMTGSNTTCDASDFLLSETLLGLGAGTHEVKGPWGRVEVLVERLQPPVHLIVCGDGPDAEPVVHFARQLGWQTTLVGTRPSYELEARFATADRRLTLPHGDDVLRRIAVDKRTAAVVLTHNYLRDRALLRHLLSSPAFYVGALGSPGRAARLRENLLELGLSPETIASLHTPVGLDVGAETPEEIALSIVAQVLAVLRGSEGGAMPQGIGGLMCSVSS
jgi:xanthine dehydrogenase accessory factor